MVQIWMFIYLFYCRCLSIFQSIYVQFYLYVCHSSRDLMTVCLTICCSSFDVCLSVVLVCMTDWIYFPGVTFWHECICCVNSKHESTFSTFWFVVCFGSGFVKCQLCVVNWISCQLEGSKYKAVLFAWVWGGCSFALFYKGSLWTSIYSRHNWE